METRTKAELVPWASVDALGRAADALNQAAAQESADASDLAHEAGVRAGRAVRHVGRAAADVVAGTEHAVNGTASLVEGAGQLAIGSGTAALGAGAWVAQEGAKGIGWLAHNLAKGLLKLGNCLSRAAGGNQYTLTKVLGDPGAERCSHRLFKKAADRVECAKDCASFAWDEYGRAFDLGVLGTAGNIALAAGNAGMMCANLGAAAATCGDVAAIKAAELGVRGAKVALMAAQESTYDAAKALLWAARVSARVGNHLSHPSDPTYEVTPACLAPIYDELWGEPLRRETPLSHRLRELESAILLKTLARAASLEAERSPA